jgi:hypothetical protein
MLAVAVALAACGSGGVGAPAAGTGQSSTAAHSRGDAASRNYSGEYAGTVKDSLYKKGKIHASFAQYQAAVGGSMTQTEGSSHSSTMSASFEVSDTTFTGTAATTIGSTVCVFTIGGAYDTAKHSLHGSYQSASGCSAESGTFTMKQKCYYAKPGADADVGGLKMC